MSTTLEERLHRLADPLSAPASETTLTAVHQQTRRLRRRRQAGRSVAVSALGIAVLAGGLVVGSLRDDTTTEVGPVADAVDDVPAVELDLDGFEELAPPIVTTAPLAPDDDESYQLFRRPDDLLGPTVWLRHGFATDTVVPVEGQEAVTIDGREGPDGALTIDGSVLELNWNPDSGQDAQATLTATGLNRDELLEFLAGLEPKGDQYGFVATYLPQGVEELALTPTDLDRRTERQHVYDDGTTQVQMLLVEEDYLTFERRLEPTLQGCAWEAHNCRDAVANEMVEVLGRPALVVVEGAAEQRWHVYWRQSRRLTVELVVLAADRATLDEILAGLVEH